MVFGLWAAGGFIISTLWNLFVRKNVPNRINFSKPSSNSTQDHRPQHRIRRRPQRRNEHLRVSSSDFKIFIELCADDKYKIYAKDYYNLTFDSTLDLPQIAAPPSGSILYSDIPPIWDIAPLSPINPSFINSLTTILLVCILVSMGFLLLHLPVSMGHPNEQSGTTQTPGDTAQMRSDIERMQSDVAQVQHDLGALRMYFTYGVPLGLFPPDSSIDTTVSNIMQGNFTNAVTQSDHEHDASKNDLVAFKDATGSRFAVVDDKVLRTAGEVSTLNGSLEDVRRALQNAERDLVTLKESAKSDQSERKRLERQIGKNKNADLEPRLTDLDSRCANLEGNNEALGNRADTFEKRLKAVDAQQVSAESIKALTKRIEVLEASKKAGDTRVNVLETALKGKQDVIVGYNAVAAATKKIPRLESSLTTLEEATSSYVMSQDLRSQLSPFHEARQEIGKIPSLEAELGNLNASLSSFVREEDIPKYLRPFEETLKRTEDRLTGDKVVTTKEIDDLKDSWKTRFDTKNETMNTKINGIRDVLVNHQCVIGDNRRGLLTLGNRTVAEAMLQRRRKDKAGAYKLSHLDKEDIIHEYPHLYSNWQGNTSKAVPSPVTQSPTSELSVPQTDAKVGPVKGTSISDSTQSSAGLSSSFHAPTAPVKASATKPLGASASDLTASQWASAPTPTTSTTSDLQSDGHSESSSSGLTAPMPLMKKDVETDSQGLSSSQWAPTSTATTSDVKGKAPMYPGPNAPASTPPSAQKPLTKEAIEAESQGLSSSQWASTSTATTSDVKGKAPMSSGPNASASTPPPTSASTSASTPTASTKSTSLGSRDLSSSRWASDATSMKSDTTSTGPLPSHSPLQPPGATPASSPPASPAPSSDTGLVPALSTGPRPGVIPEHAPKMAAKHPEIWSVIPTNEELTQMENIPKGLWLTAKAEAERDQDLEPFRRVLAPEHHHLLPPEPSTSTKSKDSANSGNRNNGNRGNNRSGSHRGKKRGGRGRQGF